MAKVSIAPVVPKETASTSKDASIVDINVEEEQERPAPVIDSVRTCYHCGHNTRAIEACGVCGMR